ncbi:hypothetical protein ACG873_01485 (plasmid) [Mesorhizobium sp. AaZ16]|uniref:hypothetical protein n=1 Tax=Mesorhizobium sp. AaZ16 TaxID=3402289 RepID=UPI00374ED33C
MHLDPAFLLLGAEVDIEIEWREDPGERGPALRRRTLGDRRANVDAVAEDAARGDHVVLAVGRSAERAVLAFEDILIVPAELHALVAWSGSAGAILVEHVDAQRLAGMDDLREAVVEADGFGEDPVHLAERRRGNRVVGDREDDGREDRPGLGRGERRDAGSERALKSGSMACPA